RALAAQLGQGEARQTFAEWLAKRPADADERSVLHIDQHFSALAALHVDCELFERRATDLSRGPSHARRPPLARSVIIDLAAALTVARDREAAFANLRERRTELSRMSTPEAAPLISESDLALNSYDAAASPDLVKRADSTLADHLRMMAATARRRA